MIRERTYGEKLAYMAGYAAALETVQRSSLEVAAAAYDLMSQTIVMPGQEHPAPGSLPKLPQSVFNLEKPPRDSE